MRRPDHTPRGVHVCHGGKIIKVTTDAGRTSAFAVLPDDVSDHERAVLCAVLAGYLDRIDPAAPRALPVLGVPAAAPWFCARCETRNPATAVACAECGS